MKYPTIDSILSVMKSKKYKVFEDDKKNYNLNLIGIRTNTNKLDSFDDLFTVSWKFKGQWNLLIFEATTDPGVFMLVQPMNSSGTAIVKEGHYPKLWKISKHKTYKALAQHSNITVVRDFNRDRKLDFYSGKEYTGKFAINCHRANQFKKSIEVGKWSAGCQVIADPNDFNVLMKLCDESAMNWGDKFTYTLLHERDFL